MIKKDTIRTKVEQSPYESRIKTRDSELDYKIKNLSRMEKNDNDENEKMEESFFEKMRKKGSSYELKNRQNTSIEPARSIPIITKNSSNKHQEIKPFQ